MIDIVSISEGRSVIGGPLLSKRLLSGLCLVLLMSARGLAAADGPAGAASAGTGPADAAFEHVQAGTNTLSFHPVAAGIRFVHNPEAVEFTGTPR